jgi:hypothetical protein
VALGRSRQFSRTKLQSGISNASKVEESHINPKRAIVLTDLLLDFVASKWGANMTSFYNELETSVRIERTNLTEPVPVNSPSAPSVPTEIPCSSAPPSTVSTCQNGVWLLPSSQAGESIRLSPAGPAVITGNTSIPQVTVSDVFAAGSGTLITSEACIGSISIELSEEDVKSM